MKNINKITDLKLYNHILGNENYTFEQLVKQVILRSFDNIKTEAEKHQVCKRKAVGAAILEINLAAELITHFSAINGPSGEKNVCSNVVGACGCSHAEPRVIMDYLKRRKNKYLNYHVKTILLSTYSPCVSCANLAIDSKIIDAFAYEIWAPYWNKHPYFADRILDNSPIRYWNKFLIEADIEMNLLRSWLLRN